MKKKGTFEENLKNKPKSFNFVDAQKLYREKVDTLGNHIDISFIPYISHQPKSTKKYLKANDFNRLSAIFSVGQNTNTKMDVFRGLNEFIHLTCKLHGSFSLQKAIMYFDGVGCPNCFKKNGEYPRNIFTMPIAEISERFNTSEHYILYLRESIRRILKPLKEVFKLDHQKHVDFQKSIFENIENYYDQKLSITAKEELIKKLSKGPISEDEHYMYQIKKISLRLLNQYDKCIEKILKLKEPELCSIEKIRVALRKYVKYRNERLSEFPTQESRLAFLGSSGEFKFFVYLLMNKINFLREVSFLSAPGLSFLRYDFFIPQFNLIVEIHGQQHSKAVDIWGGENALERTQEIDNEKEKYVIQNGFDYLAIHHKDWKNMCNIFEKKISK